ARGQFPRDSAHARPDLYNSATAAITKRRNNTANRLLIAEKILTKPGFWGHASMLADEAACPASRARLLFVLDYGKVEAPPLREPKPLIQPNRGIISKCMQKRRATRFNNLAHYLAHHHAAKSAPASIGMRAHRAHLNESRNPHALPRHRQQSIAFKDAVEDSQLMCSLAKWPWLGERGEFHHGRH